MKLRTLEKYALAEWWIYNDYNENKKSRTGGGHKKQTKAVSKKKPKNAFRALGMQEFL